MTEDIARGTLKAQRPKVAPQRICVFESIDTFPQQPSNVVEARVLTKCAASLYEMTDQMGEQIFIRHPRGGRCKKRRVYLCPRENAVRRHAKHAVRKEMVVHVDGKRPRIAGKGSSRARTHSRFEAQRLQHANDRLDVRAAYQ